MGLGRFFKKTLGGVGDFAKKASPFLSFIPGVGPLAAAGIGMGGHFLGKLNDKRPGGAPTGPAGPGAGTEGDYRNRFEQALTGMGQRGEDMERKYLEQMDTFDPTQGFAEQTEAELAQHDDNFARRYGGAMGAMVGAGRLPTKSGFGMQDTQDLIRQGQQERVAIQQRNAGAAGQARASHLYRQGEYASGMQNRFFDAVGGRMNTLEAQRLQDEADKRRNKGNIIGGLIGAAGTLGGAYLASRRN